MGLKLLTEYIVNTISPVEVLDESTNKKRMFIEGIFMQSNVVNRNHRIYPKEILAREANRYIHENVSNRRAYGELNHPAGPNINGDRIAIHIRELKEDGDNFRGKALISSGPMGQIVRALIDDGANLGVSTRALGSVKPYKESKDVNEVQDDLRLLAIDVVTDPSAPDAWVNGIMEGADWVFNPATGLYEQTKAEKIIEAVQGMTVAEIEAKKFQLFEAFMAEMSKE
jgi:hypothetical protein